MSRDISDIALRLAGLIGQSTLDQLGRDAAAVAVLDQHIAAVHAALARARTPHPPASPADALPLDPAALDSAALDSAAFDPAALASAALDPAGLDPAALDSAALDPDGPGSLADLPQLCGTAPAGPGELLQYACGFLEASVATGWQPALSPDEPADWRSLRLAAVCELITQAQLAADVHPDLRDLTWPTGY
jgi:hypothetical protein